VHPRLTVLQVNCTGHPFNAIQLELMTLIQADTVQLSDWDFVINPQDLLLSMHHHEPSTIRSNLTES
jgi:hypothetical protein